MSAEKGLVQLLYTFHFSYSQGLGVIDWWLIGLIATNISIRKYSIIVRCLRLQSTAKLSDTKLSQPPINTMHCIQCIITIVHVSLTERKGHASKRLQPHWWCHYGGHGHRSCHRCSETYNWYNHIIKHSRIVIVGMTWKMVALIPYGSKFHGVKAFIYMNVFTPWNLEP